MAFDPTQLPADLPVPVDDGAAAHLTGAAMPPIALPATSGEPVRVDTVPAGFGRLIIYAYPMTGLPGGLEFTGTPAQFADLIEDWLAEGAADGFTLQPATLPARSTCSTDRLPPFGDSDGWPDILLAGPHNVALYHNERNGTFKNVTVQSAPPAPSPRRPWSPASPSARSRWTGSVQR